jgi:long-chain acyl-CoA synthetase
MIINEQKRFNDYLQDITKNGKMIYVGRLLQRAAQANPTTTALIFRNQKISYQELYAKAITVSRLLLSHGAQMRDRLCILLENSIDFYAVYFGVWQVGAVVTPLNTFLHEKELETIVNDAQPRILITSRSFAQKVTHSALKTVVVYVEDILYPQQEDTQFVPLDLEADEMSALLYTSGTTGVPKGVMLSSHMMLTNIMQGMVRIEAGPSDRALAVLPLFHSFAQLACVWGAIFVKCTIIIVPKIDRAAILEGLTYRPTFILGVPALFGLFCLMRNASFPDVRYFISGGDAMPDKIRSAFELIYRRRICNGYGLTETSPLIAANFDDELLQPNTVGVPVVGLSCSMRDEDGNEVPYGAKGVLWVKGDNVMLGYYKAPEQTNLVIQNGWLDTGDYAFFDTAGRLVIAGRQKDVIAHKGFKIYPQEIENVLFAHPLVMAAAVIGKFDASVGEVPIACIVLKESVVDIEKELKKFCAQHLAPYKVPRHYIVLETMPLTSLRKVDKKVLRALYGS